MKKNTIIITLLLITSSNGCSSPKNYFEDNDILNLPGKYWLEVHGAIDTLWLKQSGTYVHFHQNSAGEVFQYEGKWHFEDRRSPDQDPTIVVEEFVVRFPEVSFMRQFVEPSRRNIPILKTKSGIIRLSLSYDLNRDYTKVR